MQLPPFFCRSFRVPRLQRAAGHVGRVLDLWTVQHWGKEGGLVAAEGRSRTGVPGRSPSTAYPGGPSPLLGSGRRHLRAGASTRAQGRRSSRHPALLGPAPFSPFPSHRPLGRITAFPNRTTRPIRFVRGPLCCLQA